MMRRLMSPAVDSMRTTRSFAPPAEAEWHRMISEAAFYLAEKRGFTSGHALEDWLAAEALIKQRLAR